MLRCTYSVQSIICHSDSAIYPWSGSIGDTFVVRISTFRSRKCRSNGHHTHRPLGGCLLREHSYRIEAQNCVENGKLNFPGVGTVGEV